jgi:hypothetical protein
VNRRLERTGTLWEGRFKSVLVEGGEQALLTVAAYIDLNPVRAGETAGGLSLERIRGSRGRIQGGREGEGRTAVDPSGGTRIRWRKH